MVCAKYKILPKIFLISLAFLLLFPALTQAAEVCGWSPIINPNPTNSENICTPSGSKITYALDSTNAKCQGMNQGANDTICCCQTGDAPGQCLIKATSCADTEVCVSGYCKNKDSATAQEKQDKLINPLTNLQVKIPGLDKIIANNPAVCSTSGDKTTCTLPWIAQYIKGIFNYSMSIAGILAAIVLMIGGLIWLVSSGNATRISEAKSWITGSLTGLLIMMTSYILLNQINPDLVGLKPIDISLVPAESLEAQLESKAEGKTVKGPYNLKCLEEKYMTVSYNNTPCTADNPKGYFACYSCMAKSGTRAVKFNGKSFVLVTDAANAFEKAISQTPANIKTAMDLDSGDGAWVCRSNVNSKSDPKAPSAHAYGLAVDIMSGHKNNANRVARGTDGKCPTDTPIEFINAMRNNGFRWGGDYKSNCDSMHFEYLATCSSS